MDTTEAVAQITALILRECSRHNRECREPNFDADRSDDVIRETQRRVKELRLIREALEGMHQ